MSSPRIRLAVANLLFASAQSAFALESVNVGGVKLEPGLEMGIGYIENTEQAFGAKTSTYGIEVDRSGQRWEAFIKPSLAFEYQTEDIGSFFGKTSVVSALTRGDTDGLGYTRDDPTDTDWDDAYVGWKSGDLLPSLGTNALTISVGRQPFMVGNGFLIGEGHVDQGHEGAYWLAPRRAFDWTAIAQLDVGQTHTDLFHLKSRQDVDVIDHRENITMNGFNTEWRSPEFGTYGTTMFWTRDNATPSRNGLQVKDVRGSLNPISSLPDLNVAAEYVWQRNSGEDLSAHAWYAEMNYTFSSAPWTPTLTLRHSRFSEKYDSLLYGYSGDYGYWFHGEIVGESMLFNMNQRINMVKLTAYPTSKLRTGVIGYQFSYDKAPEGVSSRDFAKEVDLYFDWMPDEHWTVGAAYGVARPESGAKQFFGSDKTSNLIEGYITYKF